MLSHDDFFSKFWGLGLGNWSCLSDPESVLLPPLDSFFFLVLRRFNEPLLSYLRTCEEEEATTDEDEARGLLTFGDNESKADSLIECEAKPA